LIFSEHSRPFGILEDAIIILNFYPFCPLLFAVESIIRLLFSVYEKFLPDIPHPTPLTSIVFVVLAFFVGLFLVHWLPSKLNRLLSKNFALTRISAVIMGTSVPLIVGVFLDVEKFALVVSAIIILLGFFYPNILDIKKIKST